MAPGSPEVDELSPTDYSDDSVDMRRSVSPPKRKRSDAGDDGGKRRRTASAAGFQPYSMAPPPLIHPLDSNHNWVRFSSLIQLELIDFTHSSGFLGIFLGILKDSWRFKNFYESQRILEKNPKKSQKIPKNFPESLRISKNP